MALGLLFHDGFDAYDVVNYDWDTVGGGTSIDVTGTLSRTGLGCLIVNANAFGPTKSIGYGTFNYILCTSYYPGGLSGKFPFNDIIDSETLADGWQQIRITHLPNNAIGVRNANDPFSVDLGASAPGVINPSAYNVIVAVVKGASAPDGQVDVYVNGVLVLTVTGQTHVPTTAVPDTLSLRSNPNATTRHDDVMLWSWSDMSGDVAPLLLSPGIYPALPVSDSAPLDWTPSTGLTHFNLVDEVPADTATYVESDTPGDVDQYVHAIPANQQVPPLPANAAILGMRYQLLAFLDVPGARQIAPNVNGVTGTSEALSTTATYVSNEYYPSPIALVTDLAANPAGPEVTA